MNEMSDEELDNLLTAVRLYVQEEVGGVRDQALRAALQGTRDVSALVLRAEAEIAGLRAMIARQMGN